VTKPVIRSQFEIIAYRGGAGERPENTVEAFSHALSLSPDVILDLDVQESKDGTLMVIHDATLERTTDGSGSVSDNSAEALRTLDAGFHFLDDAGRPAFRGRGVTVPTLEDVLRSFPDARFIVDIRSEDLAQADRVVALLERLDVSHRVIVASEADTSVDRCRDRHPEWCYGAPTGEVRRVVFGGQPRVSPVFMIPEYHNGIQVLSEGLVERLHADGGKVWIWTVDDPAVVKRLREMGVDGVFTNFPERLCAELGPM